MKHFYITFAIIFFANFMSAQIVDIPDANFKTALVSHNPIIDTNGDGEIQVSEANSFFGILDVSYKSISSLIGIQSFINITELNVNINDLTELDVSQIASLEILKFIHNDLTDIDISQNTNLREFWCNFNEFETLDFSNNINLEFISAPYMNTFTNIDLTNNINLERIFFGDTQLSSLDVSNNPDLTLIQIIDCPISSLDVSQNPLIDRLLLDGTLIQNIDIANNQNLQYLSLDETPITTIDFSENPSMFSFEANNCPNLEYINARNGQNFWMNTFAAENNPMLDYICVDDIAYSIVNFTYPNETALTEDCVNLSTDYNVIRGKLIYDIDNNGCASDDIPLPNMMIKSTNGADEYATFANEDGEYALVVGLGTFDTEVISFLNWYDASPQNSIQEFIDFGNTSFQDYCFTANQSISNIWAFMCVMEDSRPGYETTYSILAQNTGTIMSNGTMVFEFDGNMQNFVSASSAPISQTSNSVTFSYSDLAPFQSKKIYIQMMTLAPPIVNGDEVLNFTLTATPDVADLYPGDNVCDRSQVVVNSYDPNDKLVAQGEEIYIDEIDEYLIYTIRFQNTGTASAINVKVTDELSQNLDWNTLTPVDSSHEYSVQLTNGNNLEILFEDIYLPAQQDDDAASNGHFIFKIKPKNSLVVGDVIEGEAQIYFDFNPPIITNTIATEIVEDLLSVSEYESSLFMVFPNPTTSKLTIQSKVDISQVSIVDMNGRFLNRFDLSNQCQDVILDVENLSDGIYFLKIQADTVEQTIRFIKN